MLRISLATAGLMTLATAASAGSVLTYEPAGTIATPSIIVFEMQSAKGRSSIMVGETIPPVSDETVAAIEEHKPASRRPAQMPMVIRGGVTGAPATVSQPTAVVTQPSPTQPSAGEASSEETTAAEAPAVQPPPTSKMR